MKFVTITRENISFIAVDSWLEAGVRHGFLNKSIDFLQAENSWEEKFAKIEKGELFLLKQTHSSLIHVPLGGSSLLEGDGWFGRAREEGHYAGGIKTADCIPVLMTDRTRQYRAALHCGWRGSVDGILEKGIQRFLDEGIQVSDIEIAIGPGAGVCCYEIKEDVIEKIGSDSSVAIQERAQKYFLDLKALLCKQAKTAGVKSENILISESCTICDISYFSFRREKDLSGRQVSFVSFLKQ